MRDVPKTLCQPDGIKSCSACCGMYNRRHRGSDALMAEIVARTRAYSQSCDVRDPDSLRVFRETWDLGPHATLIASTPCCPFLGLIDEPRAQAADAPGDGSPMAGRVGCLVHPLQNAGFDGRDCGVYDRFICQDYLCAAHGLMRAHEQRLVIDAVPDSYLYGLVITDTRFVRELLARAADRLGAMPAARHLQSAAVKRAARAYFELKRGWPWRARDGILGHAVADGESSRRSSAAAQLGVPAHAVDAILTCLGTQVADEQGLRLARDEVTGHLDRFADAVAAYTP